MTRQTRRAQISVETEPERSNIKRQPFRKKSWPRETLGLGLAGHHLNSTLFRTPPVQRMGSTSGFLPPRVLVIGLSPFSGRRRVRYRWVGGRRPHRGWPAGRPGIDAAPGEKLGQNPLVRGGRLGRPPLPQPVVATVDADAGPAGGLVVDERRNEPRATTRHGSVPEGTLREAKRV